MLNPRAKVAALLKITQGTLDAAVAALTVFLDANADKADVDEATARASLPVPVTDQVWNEVKKAAGC